MSPNILVTGAAGYIGGSLLADFATRKTGSIATARIFACVRSPEQVDALSKVGVTVIQMDLNDSAAVEQAILSNEINVVVHTASSFVPDIPSNLIRALGKRGRESGDQTYFVHSSVTALFTAEGGWPYGRVSDSGDDIFDKEKQIRAAEGPNPVRDTSIAVVERSEEEGVKSFNVVVPITFGRGTGEVRKLSAKLPVILKSILASKVVHKYERDAYEPAAHISDLVELYALLLENILQNERLPSGEQGCYFAFSFRAHWWEIMERLARLLYQRGLVESPEVQTWPSDEIAADTLGLPLKFVGMMLSNTGELVAENAYRIGWQPEWDEKKFLESLSNEVDDVSKLDTVRQSLFDTLKS